MGDWAGAFEALGAGLQGKGNEYLLVEEERKKRLAELDEKRLKAMAMDFDASLTDLNAGNTGAAWERLLNRHEQIIKLGGDPTHTENLMKMFKEGRLDEAKAKLTQSRQAAIQDGFIEAPEVSKKQFDNNRIFKDSKGNLFFGSMISDPITGKQSPNLVPVTAEQAQTPQGGISLVDSMGLRPDERPAQLAAETRATTTADLETQWQLSPQVEAARRDAVIQVETLADLKQEERSNQKVLETYDKAMSGLVSSLGATTTGPGMSWIAGLTESGQIAKGAIAAMAPVLKSIFREAGEGTFTKDDQEILMAMLPTIDDLPAARIAKVRNVDMIVRAKLGGSISGSQKAPASPSSPQNEDIPTADGATGATTGGYEVGKTYTDANGSKAVYMGGGNWKEVQ